MAATAGSGASGGSSDPGPTTVRGQRTRAVLLEAAREIFERDGYVDARVADIASLAQVSHGTFYTYFESKQDVFRTIIRRLGGDLNDSVALPEGDDDGLSGVARYSRRVRRSNDAFLEAYRANRKMMVLYEQVATIDPDVGVMRANGRRHHASRIAASIRQLQAQGLVRKELDARTAAAALAAMVGNFAYQWLGLGEPYDPNLASATLHELWMGALGLPVDS